MSWNVPSGAVAQPTDLMGLDRSDQKTRAFEWKGPYSGLETAAASLSRGDVIETGWTCSSWELRRVAGNHGVLTINCAPANPSGTGGGILPIKETWSIKSVRNDVSIMAYCGPSGSNPNRAEIESWMKEPDGELAAQHKYRNSSGEEVDIDNAASLALIAKIEKGIEAVIRFYPVVTCRRVYSSTPPNCLENLGFIDSITSPGANAKAPANLASKLSGYQWLKVQDDCDEGQDGNWTRTESWMGIKTSDNVSDPWDADLYGANRWAMPYSNA